MYDLQLWKVALKLAKLSGKFLMVKFKEDWPKPKIKYPNQVQVKNTLGGICGSDLHQLDVDVSFASSILAKKMNPFPIGHEVIGVVADIGKEVTDLKTGDRVVYNPVASCESFGYLLCPSCKEGNHSGCYCLTGLGDKSDLQARYEQSDYGYGGGGFSEYLVGFEKQFHKIPDNVPDEIAVLAEPFGIGVHSVSRNLPKDEDTIIVYGAGIIGLFVIAALRAYESKCKIITIARYQHQADMAKKLGADEIIIERDRKKLYQTIANSVGGKLFKPTLGKKILFGGTGPDVIFDCVANEKTIDDSLHLVRNNGKIVIVGLGYSVTKKIDWALQAYKELTIVGSMMHGLDPYKGEKIDSFELALQFLSKNPTLYEGLVTHKFTIDSYKQAFNTTFKKGKNKVIKAVFDFR